MKKKIFLGAYINVINAQNINCKSIASHLDKKKYSVKTLVLGDENIESLDAVSCIKVSILGYKISNFVAFIKGMLWADVCYFPKHQSTPKLILKIANFLDKKIFTTIEGNMCDTSKKSMVESFGSLENMKSYLSMIPNIFGITPHLILSSNCGVKINNYPLFLGVDKSIFSNNVIKNRVENLVFIGSLIKRKNLNDILDLAKHFKNITFNIIGDGPLKDKLKKKSTPNVHFFGELNSYDISNLLQNMDLHILLSRSEGFPKVILETASSAIPSLLYNDYGADRWINHSENGFVVSTFEEVKDTIDSLIKSPALLRKNSENVLELAEKFDWKIIIKSWEKVIDNLK